jgi:hypothetical protein
MGNGLFVLVVLLNFRPYSCILSLTLRECKEYGPIPLPKLVLVRCEGASTASYVGV